MDKVIFLLYEIMKQITLQWMILICKNNCSAPGTRSRKEKLNRGGKKGGKKRPAGKTFEK
jgi:hypothetical protein